MSECDKCNDTGFIDVDGTLKECTCRIKKALLAYLPDIFSKYPVAKKFDHKPFEGSDFVYKTELSKFGSFANTLLTRKFLLNRKFTYDIVTAYAFIEKGFDSATQNYYDCDLLFLLIYGGYKNKLYQDWIPSLIKDRQLNNLQTIIFIDKNDYPEEKLRDWFGSDFALLLGKIKKIGGK